MKRYLLIALMSLAAGLWMAPALAEEKPIATIEQAQEVAKKAKKDILVDFSGSDWCGWCVKLDEEVFATEGWKKDGARKYVLVVLDFPRQKEQPKEQKEYNRKVQSAYGVTGFPSVFVLDADGKPYARTGYQKGGPESYLKHLEGFTARKKERDELMAKMKAAKPAERLAPLDTLLNKLKEWQVDFGYIDLKEKAVELDSDNKAGLRLKYAAELFSLYAGKNEPDKSDYYFQIVKELDPAKAAKLELDGRIKAILDKYGNAKDWNGAIDELNKLLEANPQGEAAQSIYYYIGWMHYQLKDNDKAVENLEKALEYAPESELAGNIRKAISDLKKQK